MALSHQEIETREANHLAPYAQKSRDSRGRRYPQPNEGWRTRFQRDRDRIIHSRAFRRLEYKTQVFLNGTGDHLRTRLTHTMEVAAVSRNIARALNLNEDLTEAISLAHDLGHSPFGHKGEDALNELMIDAGGFEHNKQSLRIVEILEQKYPDFPGLNLSWEVREGLAKHQTTYDSPDEAIGFEFNSPSLEAQVSNLADEITYYSHDLDDGLESELLSERELMQNIEIWANAANAVKEAYPKAKEESRRYFIIRCIIDREVKDVVQTTEGNLLKLSPSSADDIRKESEALVSYSDIIKPLNAELRDYLYKNLYYHPEVHGPNLRAVKTLKALFELFLHSPEKMGSQAQSRRDEFGLKRVICDYLSGMTDPYVRAQAKAFQIETNW
jgi:dGTPase